MRSKKCQHLSSNNQTLSKSIWRKEWNNSYPKSSPSPKSTNNLGLFPTIKSPPSSLKLENRAQKKGKFNRKKTKTKLNHRQYLLNKQQKTAQPSSTSSASKRHKVASISCKVILKMIKKMWAKRVLKIITLKLYSQIYPKVKIIQIKFTVKMQTIKISHDIKIYRNK